jgi:NADH-quinone oxidoreductase subunit E
MLSDDEKSEIDRELLRYPTKRAVSMDALMVVQRHRGGWVSDESLRDVAEYLSMTPHELDSSATFYSRIYRRPVGRHVILLCNSISCWVMGYGDLRAYLHRRLGINLGETTADKRFTVLPIVCLGTCDHAPALMIDDDLYRDVRPDQLDAILERYT